MTTPRLGAPELLVDQAVPETTVNEQIRYLESAAGHFIFKSRVVAAPPGSPADGDCYLVAASPTGAWSGQAGKIAFLVNTAWVFITPIEGFTAWVNDENAFIGYDGAAWNVLASPSGTYVPLSYLDTDGTLAANSDSKIASQKAVRTYVASKLVGMFDLRGSTDCSANPNYPAASKGDTYVVTVAGKIGGASGTSVNVGDIYFATADNAGGTQAAVGTSWDTVLHAGSLSGALLAASNLSDLSSASAARTNLGLLRLIAFFFTTTPTSSEVLGLYVAADAFTIPANMSGTRVNVGTNPQRRLQSTSSKTARASAQSALQPAAPSR
jgi:hypothetical protein